MFIIYCCKFEVIEGTVDVGGTFPLLTFELVGNTWLLFDNFDKLYINNKKR